ncbi:hypothetical protein MINTM008_34150 [Mycobacterium intracellulare]|nr:hypothetical protein MINTM008_34150 [Mycobacterium intracellulare]BCO79526.1 hypothetical protein MINTM009_33080 [Mycobacterium intracellulare]BCP43455.1 hypothetical protein MINTMi27_35480 [Mycobacterium intracellulare]
MTITRPGAHRSMTSTGHGSPPTTSATESSPCGESAATADGVWLSTVTRSAISKACRSSGEPTMSSGTTTRRPPRSSAPKISQTEKSKAGEWQWLHTRPRSSRASTDRNSWVTLWCVTATPLGTPVVPEV